MGKLFILIALNFTLALNTFAAQDALVYEGSYQNEDSSEEAVSKSCSLTVTNFELNDDQTMASFDYALTIEDCKSSLSSKMCKKRYLKGEIDFEEMRVYSDNTYSQSASKIVYEFFVTEFQLQIDFMADNFVEEMKLRSFSYASSSFSLKPLGTKTDASVKCVVNAGPIQD